MDEFSSTHGLVFLIPFAKKEFILAQVGFGGDLGVFDGLYGEGVSVEDIDPDLLFRVHFGRVSPRKFNWINRGMHPFKDNLSSAFPFVHSAIGSDECFVVTHGEEDRAIDCSNSDQYEPLATWSHEHIVARFRQRQTPTGS